MGRAVYPVSTAGVVRARTATRLPVVLTPTEVRSVIERMQGTHRIIATLLYGSGMRLLECMRIRVKDIDFERREILIRVRYPPFGVDRYER